MPLRPTSRPPHRPQPTETTSATTLPHPRPLKLHLESRVLHRHTALLHLSLLVHTILPTALIRPTPPTLLTRRIRQMTVTATSKTAKRRKRRRSPKMRIPIPIPRSGNAQKRRLTAMMWLWMSRNTTTALTVKLSSTSTLPTPTPPISI